MLYVLCFLPDDGPWERPKYVACYCVIRDKLCKLVNVHIVQRKPQRNGVTFTKNNFQISVCLVLSLGRLT
jgi:hypothetical protein